MSWLRRSVSGGVLSSPVLSRQGGMAAGEFRMKAPNDGTSIQRGSGMNWSLWVRRLVMLGRINHSFSISAKSYNKKNHTP
uniref:Uncharacterized protein n=1 Tax=Tanacetum cinerariifolium TaxID=118510 RepID=A0A699WGU7_TANCI|nr:hypothetical protein [Tanacetum cinerariifolium]